MQYKIPVQIENADKIAFGLSLKQLSIIIIGLGIGYNYFQGMKANVGTEIAAIPSVIIIVLSIVIALFKNHEMNFMNFILSIIRLNINTRQRYWINGIDSFQPIDIGYIKSKDIKVEEKIDFKSKMDKIKELDDKLKKI